MPVYAAAMTGPGLGAIATVQLFGATAETLLRGIFRKKDGAPFELVQGRILLGHIVDNGATLDEVTVGCEGPCCFAIHCHGNPLIVERLMALLRRQGAQAVPSEQLLARILARDEPRDSIRVEAKLALTTVKTMAGAAIIANQVKAGLSEKVRQWQDRLDSTPLEAIAAEAGDILKFSEPARLIVSGCTIALVGPPNTGKSTLLNTLAGREKAIVSETRGTTRDWVSAEIHLPPLAATIIDTAGLDPSLRAADAVDQAAQQRSLEIIQRADLVLLVLDRSQPAEQLTESALEPLAGKKVIPVLNKDDLPSHFDPAHFLNRPGPAVPISARQGRGIEDLIHAIHRICNVVEFTPHLPVAFTDRQRHLLRRLQRSSSRVLAHDILSQLLESPLISPSA
ncbi:MAG: GTP-binding protein [Planctomycetes bacterium]|nr:GTP-binding protein [Planctomycetota bacterium]